MFSSVGGADSPSPSVPSASTRPGGVDEADHHGNTPLLLALQLNRLECANVSFVGLSLFFHGVWGEGFQWFVLRDDCDRRAFISLRLFCFVT